MGYKNISIIGLALTMLLLPFKASPQNRQGEEAVPLTRILFLFDASQSMYGRWQSDLKINIARNLLSDLLDSIKEQPNVELALRVYGHQKPFPPQDCDDTKLEVSFFKNNHERIKQKLKTIIPKGTTPIAISLEAAGNDFPKCSNCRNVIVLITDGIEECSGDPCAVSKSLQEKGVVLKPFVIGIGREFTTALDCIGKYFEATTEIEFRNALNVVISQALNPTTAQVNLLDINSEPTETNVNMTFYDQYSGQIKYNFIHTMNSRGFPDTLDLDPLPLYKVVAHTVPPVFKDSVKVVSGKHTIIGISAPQGYLNVRYTGRPPLIKPIPCIVRQQGKTETLVVQNLEQTGKYIVGKYDLEVLCLPRLTIKDVEVKQSHTTTVDIPVPGVAYFQYPAPGYGSLYTEEKDKLTWIYNLSENTQQETLVLLPGNYKVVYRSKYANSSYFTIEKSFSVQSGQSLRINVSNN